MASPSFAIDVIADVTCDIAPLSSIPSTLRATTIDDPVFGFDPARGHEIEAHAAHGIDMMTVDNLPNELPRDASESFGKQLMAHVIPELLKERSEILERATVAVDGQLGEHFSFLTDYISANLS